MLGSSPHVPILRNIIGKPVHLGHGERYCTDEALGEVPDCLQASEVRHRMNTWGHSR